MKTEKSALWLSAATALAVGIVGVIFSLLTGSQAILLDGLFNISYFVTALLTIKVAHLLTRPDTEDYPLGYSYFEPLMNGIKGLLILGISMIALVDAIAALLQGGRSIAVGAAIGYGVLATVACSTTAYLLRRAHRANGSPLVGADAASWLVNAAISGSVLVVFCAVPIIKELGWSSLAPYVDPLLVAVIVVISLIVPVRMAWRALMAMLNGAPPPEFRTPIVDAVRSALADLPSRSVYVRMILPGRTLHLAVHVVLPEDFAVAKLGTLDAIRDRVDAAVRGLHDDAIVDVLFTADENRAAPAAAITAEVSIGAAW